MFVIRLADTVKSIYRTLFPPSVRDFVYRLRHPEHRLGEKLGRIARAGVEDFLDSLAGSAILRGNVLEVGAGGREQNRLRFGKQAKNYWRSDLSTWPGTKLNLLCNCIQMPFAEGALDAVICSEVLEHVPGIFEAIEELARIIKPGGYLVVTMPFFFPVHAADERGYGDFWRLTPANLRAVLSKDFAIVKEEGSHVFSSADPFIVDIQVVCKRT